MRMFWEFFSFEVRLRRKSISTYIYFLLWFTFYFLCVASESFGPVGNSNGKVLLNGPYANTIYSTCASLFGIIIIAAIFGTSILRDFQRDTYQMLFTKPISKFAYLGGRWAGSMVVTVFVFSGCLLGEFAGTFAPWADHARIGPNHLWWYLQPFLSITVVQIFFIGSLFFTVAALSRKIFVVYVQGAALFMIYLIGLTVFSATRSLERFWSGIFDPIGFVYLDDITRYWTVVERNTLLLSWSPSVGSGVFLYNRLLWLSVGCISLVALWALFPMSVEALTAVSQGRRAAKAKTTGRTGAAAGALAGCRAPSAGAPVFWPVDYLGAISLAVASADLHHPARNSVLGHRRADDRLRGQQRILRREGRGGRRLARHLPDAAGGGRRRNSVSSTSSPLCMPPSSSGASATCTSTASMTHCRWEKPSTGSPSSLAIAFVEVVLLAVTMLCGILMQTHRRLLPLRAAAILQGTVRRHLPASPDLCLAGFVRADHGQQQVHRPRHRDRHLRPGPHPVHLGLGKHALPVRQHSALYLQRHERLRPLRAGAVLVDHLLARDLRISRRHLHRLDAARRRRQLDRAPPILRAPVCRV